MRAAVVESVLIAVTKPFAVCVVEAVIHRRMTEFVMAIGVGGKPMMHIVIGCPLAIVAALFARVTVPIRTIVLQSRRRAHSRLGVKQTRPPIAPEGEWKRKCQNNANPLCSHETLLAAASRAQSFGGQSIQKRCTAGGGAAHAFLISLIYC